MTLSGYAGNSTENYSYDDNNRLVSSVKNIGSTSYYTDYTYDRNGNQTKIEKYTKNNDGVFKLSIVNGISKGNRGIEEFTYNSLNQLTGYESITGQYNGKAGLKAEYKYMANGYRLSKSVNGQETRYLWDKDNVVAELNDMNVISQKYYRGCNLICDDSNNYYMHDIHGNIIEIYRGNNKYCNDWYIYNAFGTNKYFDDTSAPNKWGYCDQLMDFETGNYYMRARYYNPDTGRFISEDPIKDGSNWYSYCGGNPVMFWDPIGLKDVPIRDTIVGLGGSVTWYSENNVAKIELDGQTIYAYNNDKNGSYFKIDNNVQKVMYCDNELLFKSLAVVVDLGKGWQGRIERNTSGNNSGKKHIYNGKESYSQNEDGSPHDGSKGSPPKAVKKKLKELKGWDLDANVDELVNKIDISICEDGTYIITYPNGRKVEYYFAVGPVTTIGPSRDELREYYTGSTDIYINPWDNLGSVYAPTPSPGTFALPAPNLIPALP